jgi:ribose transport system ATP-binding protein
VSTAVLQLAGMSKRFPGVVALDDVSVDIGEREVVGLIGQNGSGKSTLLKILAGVQVADAGTMTLRGAAIRPRSVAEANRYGIGMVFQEQSLLPNLTVAENIFLGKATAATRRGLYRWKALNRAARAQLDKVELDVDPRAVVETLPFGQRQMVELAKVLALEELSNGPLVVLFDEPTSVLSGDEIQVLFRQVRRLRERSSVVFVSHRLEEVLEVSDRVYVLSDGRCMAERPAAGVDTDELYRLMVGEERAQDYYFESHREGYDVAARPRLSVQQASGDGFQDISFDLPAGSVLGLAGVQGAGREAFVRTLFGAQPLRGGRIELDGRRCRFSSPAHAVEAGFGYVPAERKVEGMLAGRDLHENVVLAAGRQFRRGAFIDRRREAPTVADWLATLQVRTPSPHVRIEQLSGGNQQKVVLAKWLASERLKVLVLDHPTRGLDLRAKTDVYRVVRRLAARGLAIVLLSDTLEETLGLADQVIVMRDGVISGRFADSVHEKPSSEELVRLMV